MSSIKIQKIGVTKLSVDAIVNAANSSLLEGGGVCGAIFREAGSRELTIACNKYRHCEIGNAVITPGFNLNAKFIIHAVGPQWIDGNHGEPSLLYDAYKNSLELAKQNDCHSIGFPLISSGIFGYPKEGAWRKAIRACVNFIKRNPDYCIDIIFAILDDDIITMGDIILSNIIEETGVSFKSRDCLESVISEELDAKAQDFFKRNLNLIKAISNDATLSKWFREYSVYEKNREFEGLQKIINEDFFKKAYDEGLIIPQYEEIIENSNLDINQVTHPTDEWVTTLTKLQILSCVTYQFRADHFCEGSLYNHSIGEGLIIPYFEGYLKK